MMNSYIQLLYDLKISSLFQASSRTYIYDPNPGEIVGTFYHSRKYLMLSPIFYLYKNQIMTKMEYFCHINGWSCSIFCFLDLIEFKIVYIDLWRKSCSAASILRMLLYHYFQSSVTSVLTFIVEVHKFGLHSNCEFNLWAV